MSLGVVILCVLAVASCLAALAPARVDPRGMLGEGTGVAYGDRLAVAILLLWLGAIGFRSSQFGIDTATYADAFRASCADLQGGFDSEFAAATQILNAAMLGACDARLLPAAWVLVVLAGIMCARGSLLFKSRYAALFLFSLVGLELTTNALRQGFAVGLMVAAYSYLATNRGVALVLGAGAVSLHSSAALTLAMCMISLLPWRQFLMAFAILAALGIAIFSSGTALEIGFGPLERAFYEIEKYLGHDSDELWIRVLSFAALLACLSGPLLSEKGREGARAILRHKNWQIAARIVLTAVPFLGVPYFGYRYVYGIFPIVLWQVLSVGEESPSSRFAVTKWIGGLNIALLLIWSLGSSYMRSVPFIG
jgi:hypothetical protein